MTNNTKFSVLLADDHEIMLDGLSAIINAEPTLQVIDVARNGSELVVKYEQLKPEICIVDLDMPIMNGLQASELLLKKYEGIKIIILTMHKENSIIKRIKCMGVKGYVLKTCDSDELLFAIKHVLKGKTYYSEEIISEEFSAQETESSEMAKISQLTKRELEIVKLLCDGLSNTKIAERLFLSPSTVDNHRTNIMRKLDVHNVVELTRFCLNNRLL
jgi:DNA-binding NarL/FixJ family response regulator